MPENLPPTPTAKAPRPWVGWTVFALTLLVTVLVCLLGLSVLQRRQEAKVRPPLQPIDAWESDSKAWAINWPREYASFTRTANDKTHTKHGGGDPRDLLAETPANVVLFAGYAFARQYRQARGHFYAVEDVTGTQRVRDPKNPEQFNDKTAATCWTCKSPDVPRLMNQIGPEKFYAGKFADHKDQMKNAIGCLDCHEPNTMRLRISRPALREAFARQGKNIDQVSHQEMRSLVCAQCHVEYYFKGEGNYLTFPWDKGMGIEQIEQYYDQAGFKDWVHAISKAPMLKMQHPDYEIYSKGIHAYRNVACADCHMPYRTEGGAKFTDHHVQSPLLNIANSCGVCHRWSETEIRQRVESIQDSVAEGRARAERAIAYAHFDIAAAMQAGADDAQLQEARKLVRKAQVRWDYVAANNGMGFHAPQECLRILAAAVELAQESRLACSRILAARGFSGVVNYPDFSSKEKAQALIKQFMSGQSVDLLGRQPATRPAANP